MMEETPATIVVTRLAEMTDVILVLPELYSACRSNPGVRFVFVTRKSLARLFVNTPPNLTVEGISVADYKGIKGGLRLFKALRAKWDFMTYVDLNGTLLTRTVGFLSRLNGIRTSSAKKDTRAREALIRANNKVMLPLTLQRLLYRDALRHAGIKVDPATFTGIYGAGGKGDPALFAAITKEKEEGEKWIGIAPFAKHKGKIYPLKSMEKVVEELSHEPGTRIFLLGGGDEEIAVLKEWEGRYPGVISVASKSAGFAVEYALMSHLDVMLTMDSANMHLASLVGIEVVTVWGATHPYCGFMGWNQREADNVQLAMPCRPCALYGDRPCGRGDYRCLSAIKPKVIVERVKSVVFPEKQ